MAYENKVWGVNDVVQIDPAHDERFGGCFLLVTEVKAWGVQGFVQIPGDDGGRAFYRLPWSGGILVGHAAFVPANQEDGAPAMNDATEKMPKRYDELFIAVTSDGNEDARMNTAKALDALSLDIPTVDSVIQALKSICEDPKTSIDDLCKGLKASTELVRQTCATELYKRTGRPRERSECCTDFNKWTQWIAQNYTKDTDLPNADERTFEKYPPGTSPHDVRGWQPEE